MAKWVAVAAFSLAFWGWYSAPAPPVEIAAGITAPQPPQQRALTNDALDSAFEHPDYRITPLASFELKAKVLARKNYRFGREAELSPVDLALGWQQMSDQAIVDQIEFSQAGRWYRWRVSSFPIPRSQIEIQSANMHLIPADSYIAKQLAQVRVGEIVDLRGQLVEVQAPDGWRWRSSLSRNDTGAQACELFLVSQLTVLDFQ